MPQGRRLLVVEDEYLIADDIRRKLEGEAAEVIGPVAAVDEAANLIEAVTIIDGALLDSNLRGGRADGEPALIRCLLRRQSRRLP